MKIQDPVSLKKFAFSTLRLTVLITFLSLLPMAAVGQKSHHMANDENVPPKLVQDVRQATQQFTNVNNATAIGYGPFLGCVSGPDHGAMGIHYVNGALLNGTVDVQHPQALIYEPSSEGKLTLVGVEYIADAATWLSSHTGPPVLDGQVFNFVDSPNRFNIPSFFELHVWAYRNNPQGSFVDWNNHVSCNGQ